VAGKLLKTNIVGCMVNGAALADLSSEKVYVKLQRMTCPQPGGKVAVSEVKGFIAFGGKTGVRGRVVNRRAIWWARPSSPACWAASGAASRPTPRPI
jgi:hypothetical protein